MKQVLILDGQIIQDRVIDTQAEAAIWLLIKQNGSTCRGLRRSDKPGYKVGLNVSLQGFQLYWP